MAGAVSEYGIQVQRIMDEFGSGAKIWMTVNVLYEPAYPDNPKHHAYEQDLSASATRFFHRPSLFSRNPNPYKEDLKLIGDRIKNHTKFICDQSSLRLAGILSLTSLSARYHPFSTVCDLDQSVFLKVFINNVVFYQNVYSKLYFQF